MLNPPNPTAGRGALFFAALMLGLGLFLGFGRQLWRDAALWLAISIFMACYGALTLGALPRLHRLLLLVGLAAGGIALWLAIQASAGGT